MVFEAAQLLANVPILSETWALLKGARTISIIRIRTLKQANMAVKRVFLRLRIEQRILEFEQAFIFSPSYLAALETNNTGALKFTG
jgi:hypothetical protein